MKKLVPLCLLLIVALIWTVSIAGTIGKSSSANFNRQVTIEKKQKAVEGQSAAVDEMTPDKAARIKAAKDARHEEILRSLLEESREAVSSEKTIEYPPDVSSNAGETVPEYFGMPISIAELSMPDTELRMRELKADGVIDASERAEYERLLSEAPVIEIPVPLPIVSEVEPNNTCDSAQAIVCGDTVWCATQTTTTDDHDWFVFTLDNTYPSWQVTIETHPTGTSCPPASSDTYIELWTGDCQTFITYDDDGGVAYFSLINTTLLPGTYAIHEDNTIYNSDGSYHLSLSCAEDTCFGNEPPNDDCTAVTPVTLTPDVPSVFTGTSTCATVDCPNLYGPPEVWIAFTTTIQGDLSIEYCGSLYNGGPWGNFYIVLDGTCPCTTHTYYSSFDFGCADGNGRIYWDNLPAGTWYYPVMNDPANNAGGAYTITVTIATIIPCVVICPPNAIIEGEPPCSTGYVDSTNGGCNSSPPVFSPYNCGDTVCGETGTYLYQSTEYRDTDWFEFTTTGTKEISLTATAEVPFQLLLGTPGSPTPCVGYIWNSSGTADECDTLTISAGVRPAGTYWAWVGPSVFSGYPCGSEYWMTVECVDPIGRCCYNNDLNCVDTTEAGCAALGGTWVYGLNCTDNPCLCPEDQVVIEIMTDDYPGETTWDLVDQYSGVIASGGPLSSANTLHTWEVCVESTTCLVFTIYDSWGDGICCYNGYGYYNVYFNGNLEGTGGEFFSSESVGPFGNGCIDLGRCCYGDPYAPSCVDTTEAGCADLGGSWSWGLNCIDDPCPALPANDSCSGAITVAVPSDTPGSTISATPDTTELCGVDHYANGVWYKVIGTGNTITASLCDAATNYDTKIQVWCNTCTSPVCVGGNDDDYSCTYSTSQSTFSWCSELGAEYLILVGGYGINSGNFVLHVYDDGTPCTYPPDCAPPIGRCCYNDDQNCDDISFDDCTALGGYWHELLNCTDNPCACPTGQDKIIVDLTTDYYPGEITWEIYDRNVGLIAFGGPYPEANTNYLHEICVDQGGCYDWYIYDSYGDGGGPYDLYYAGALVHSSDGDYGTGEHVYDIGGSGCGEPTGACCVASECVATNTQSECLALSGTWYIGEDCATFECPPFGCASSSLFSQNPTPPAGGWTFGNSEPILDSGPGYLIFENFSGLTGDVCNIHFWGAQLYNVPNWHDCGEDPVPFVFTFYADNGGIPDTANPLCTYVDTISAVGTGEVYLGIIEAKYYETVIDPCCTITDGWISIAAAGDPACWFMWLSSGETGFGFAYQMWMDGDSLSLADYDLSLCLTPASAGDCCEYAIGGVNGDTLYNGLDITYGVAYFKGGPGPNCPDCPLNSCDSIYYCGDVNGSCSYNGLDITYGVAYFKGGPAAIPCEDCPKCTGITGGINVPETPQVIKSKTIFQQKPISK